MSGRPFSWPSALLLVGSLLCSACTGGATDPGPADLGPKQDTGPRDSGVRDSGSLDLGLDATADDLGPGDDGGSEDAAPLDAEPLDSGFDAGSLTDTGLPADSGAPFDAAPTDGAPLDTGVPVDAGFAPDATPGDAGADAGVYAHSIVVDGVQDFTAEESFATTSASFSAYLSWDATQLYVGYQGPDLSGTSGTEWVLVYFDTGSGTGSDTGQTYNTETPAFPTGFRPDYYLRWKVDGTYSTLEHYSGGVWSTVNGAGINSARAGDLVELSVPLADLGGPGTVLITSFMLNEAGGGEAAFAGLYADNFVDGYHASIPISRWVAADLASPLPPNDPSRARP